MCMDSYHGFMIASHGIGIYEFNVTDLKKGTEKIITIASFNRDLYNSIEPSVKQRLHSQTYWLEKVTEIEKYFGYNSVIDSHLPPSL